MKARALMMVAAIGMIGLFTVGGVGCGGSDNPQTCDGGSCSNVCEAPETECSGACVNTQSDVANCGGCGVACGAGEVCTQGVCNVPCDASRLTASVTDPWGTAWDGLERTAATLDAATVQCGAFGGRLPTATEVLRVSASRGGPVGQSFNTNFLWTTSANDRLNQATARLSDGGTSAAAAASSIPYRCVCPSVAPRQFTGRHCNGPAGAECFKYGAYNIDKEDRPPLRKSAAIQECVSEHAHLIDLPLLGAAIGAGLPGSNAFIGTADGYRYDMTTTVRWNSATWELGPNVSGVAHQTPVPFRCAGSATRLTPTDTPAPNPFVGKLSPYKGEGADAPASGWAAAHDTCWLRGGHLPRATELAELIGQGLPGGSATDLWTADQLGYNGAQFLAALLRWPGVDRRFPFEYTGGADLSANWDYKYNSHPFRCIYYPLDRAFTPPTTCNGGCNVRSAGSPAVTIFFDQSDRPAATVAAAMRDCATTGGYLASERDLTEAIRGELPNGSGPWLATGDVGQGNVMIVQWTGTNKLFDDQYSTYMTWEGPTGVRPYRCMWTNEIR